MDDRQVFNIHYTRTFYPAGSHATPTFSIELLDLGFPAATKSGYEQFVAFEKGVEPRFTFQGCLHDT